MSKVSRSDWAASVPWDGVTDKPPFTPGATDIGQLTGVGFAEGQFPRFLNGRFRPATIPAPSPAPAPTPAAPFIIVSWDTPSLMPLQSAWEDFAYPGVLVSQPITLGTPFADEFVIATASVPAANVVRITVVNMNLATVDLAVGSWTIRL